LNELQTVSSSRVWRDLETTSKAHDIVRIHPPFDFLQLRQIAAINPIQRRVPQRIVWVRWRGGLWRSTHRSLENGGGTGQACLRVSRRGREFRECRDHSWEYVWVCIRNLSPLESVCYGSSYSCKGGHLIMHWTYPNQTLRERLHRELSHDALRGVVCVDETTDRLFEEAKCTYEIIPAACQSKE
jgi:hypothetical protein